MVDSSLFQWKSSYTLEMRTESNSDSFPVRFLRRKEDGDVRHSVGSSYYISKGSWCSSWSPKKNGSLPTLTSFVSRDMITQKDCSSMIRILVVSRASHVIMICNTYWAIEQCEGIFLYLYFGVRVVFYSRSSVRIRDVSVSEKPVTGSVSLFQCKTFTFVVSEKFHFQSSSQSHALFLKPLSTLDWSLIRASSSSWIFNLKPHFYLWAQYIYYSVHRENETGKSGSQVYKGCFSVYFQFFGVKRLPLG